MACSRAACLSLIVRQVLANNFGTSLLGPLRAALYPGRGYGRHTPWAGMKPDIMPHGNLGNHIPAECISPLVVNRSRNLDFNKAGTPG